MINKEEAVLQVRDLLLRYGQRLRVLPQPAAAGKEPLSPLRYCLGLYAMYPLTFIPEKY